MILLMRETLADYLYKGDNSFINSLEKLGRSWTRGILPKYRLCLCVKNHYDCYWLIFDQIMDKLNDDDYGINKILSCWIKYSIHTFYNDNKDQQSVASYNL